MLEPNNKFDELRTKSNIEILNIIQVFLKENPSLRLGQALLILEVVLENENFQTIEPSVVLDRMKNTHHFKELDSKGLLK